MQAEFRAKYAESGKFLRQCKACGKLFYAYRPDAQTCSQRCRKAQSRSPSGALARLKRLGRSDDQYKADREQAARRARSTERGARSWRTAKVDRNSSGLLLAFSLS
jgi:predicted  nucleic acid-binding Zn-ribbon protein